MARVSLPVLIATVIGAHNAVGSAVSAHGSALLASWSRVLDESSSHDTPVTRVVNLLKNMGKTVQAEMDEDEGLFHKLQCWCNDNDWEKGNAVENSEAKISELQSDIESLTGSTAELRISIKELESQSASDKKALAEATAIRQKQIAEFHDGEKDSIQAVENLKAALTVLGKHHEAPPESTVDGGAIFKSERDQWSFVQVQDFPSREMRSFNTFLRDNGIDTSNQETTDQEPSAKKAKFLQQQGSGSLSTETEWSAEDSAVVQRAVKSASAFVQSRQGAGYYPAYTSQSGEIMGVLKQLQEEMEADLSESQKREMERANSFAELRAAKMDEIRNGDNMAERKEDQLANQDNALAEAKEDLAREDASLSADQKFLKNLKETCSKASTNFDERKTARLNELKAISETIEILQGDVARDAMSGTFNFIQVSKVASMDTDRQRVAQKLRRVALASKDPRLSILATSVELDAFTKVKKAIDNMIGMLNVQQKDEVKKNDWCKLEFQSNEMSTSKTQSHRSDLEVSIAKLESDINAHEVEIADALGQIAKTHTDLQKASGNRKEENLDFQKVIADQTTTIEVLKKALDKLATYYDLVQTKASPGHSWIQRQTPDVPQMEYKKSQGSTGVMEMIEKLVNDARELMKDSQSSESAAQSAYEQLISDSNDSVAALQKEVMSRTKAKIGAEKDKRDAESDLGDTMKDLEGLAKYNAELHAECDYLLKNFDVRQNGRAEEIEALQQAKQILNGAILS